jgi:hypothetical protein
MSPDVFSPSKSPQNDFIEGKDKMKNHLAIPAP